MNNCLITFDKDKQIEVPLNTSYLEISKHSMYKDTVLGVKKNNEIIPLTDKVSTNETIEFFDINSLEGTKMYKAGIKFILEVALKNTLKNSEVIFLHSVPGGMLSEIKTSKIIDENDISLIKQEMARLIDADLPFIKYNVLKSDASKYYYETNTPEKALNISTCDNIITIYKLDKYLNYFYVNLPMSTKCLNKFTLKYLGNNRLIILYPSYLSKGKIPEYVHHQEIINTFYEAQEWLKKLNTPYLADLNKLVNDSKIKGFIESCELHYNDQIRKVSEEIVKNSQIKFVMIAGPSSSGKTTTTRILSSYLRSIGYKPICISTDDYFVDRVNNPKDEYGEYDYECLQALDIEALNHDLLALLKGEEIITPTFNFITGKKELSNNHLKLEDNSILLMEGLHSLNDELTPYIPQEYKYKIYLSPFIPLNIDRHNYISTIDLRLIRRIIRDKRTRGKSFDVTLKGWRSVRSGEEKYIFPYTHQANWVINTALPYEIGVLKVYIEPILYSVSNSSPYYEEARRLIKFLASFYPISSEYVSQNSMLREFIGGEYND